MEENKDTLVSILIPLYNCEKFFGETIESVLSQTYTNWEAICVDDCSKDESLDLARTYAAKDSRIKVYCHEVNSGAAHTRNTALSKATGRYIAFLDSDDLWENNKLEKQIKFMSENNVDACITSYATVEEDGSFRNEVIVPQKTTYKSMLKAPLTCSHTIMFDTKTIDKELILMPETELNVSEDFVAWLRVAKNGHNIYGMSDVLAKYRRHEDSRSSSKFSAMNKAWNVYRKVEHINVFSSAINFIGYAFNAVKKHKK